MKAVLKRLSAVLRRPLSDIGLGSRHQHSLLARFIFQKGHFSRTRAKANAFLPKPPALEISAICRDGLLEREIWPIGDLLGQTGNRRPLARADFDAEAVSEAGLTIEPDPQPHPRHVNLCGWPTEKDEQKEVALHLCARATLQMR